MKKFLMFPILLVAACGQEEPVVCHNDSGFLITNVQVIDGSGSPAVPGSVRVTDGLIAEIGDLSACEAETVVDGGGQTLAPIRWLISMRNLKKTPRRSISLLTLAITRFAAK